MFKKMSLLPLFGIICFTMYSGVPVGGDVLTLSTFVTSVLSLRQSLAHSVATLPPFAGPGQLYGSTPQFLLLPQYG